MTFPRSSKKLKSQNLAGIQVEDIRGVKSIDKKEFKIEDIQFDEDRVVVDPDEKHERKTAGGIIIMKDSEERDSLKWGTVVNIGKDTKDFPMKYTIGDRILYGKYAGSEFYHDGKEYLVMRQGDIFGKL